MGIFKKLKKPFSKKGLVGKQFTKKGVLGKKGVVGKQFTKKGIVNKAVLSKKTGVLGVAANQTVKVTKSIGSGASMAAKGLGKGVAETAEGVGSASQGFGDLMQKAPLILGVAGAAYVGVQMMKSN